MGRIAELLTQRYREQRAFDDECKRIAPNWYMVSVNFAGSVYVKELALFHKQGGFREPWGSYWSPVVADNLEAARAKGCKLLSGARPYEQQAKP